MPRRRIGQKTMLATSERYTSLDGIAGLID
jgi:hypothetical protein